MAAACSNAALFVRAQEPTLNLVRAALLLPLFAAVFDDEPPAAGSAVDAAWGWGTSLKARRPPLVHGATLHLPDPFPAFLSHSSDHGCSFTFWESLA